MAKIKYENWACKVFPGFYESSLSSEGFLYGERCPEGYYLDVADEDAYRQDVCREWVKRMEHNWSDNPIGMKVMRYVRLWSPSCYNFSTDRITIEIEVNLNKLKDYCWKERAEDFDNYLHKHWSSRDGFCSFIPNRLSAFKETYRMDKSERSELVDIMIEWYLLEHIDWMYVENDVYEHIYEIVSYIGVVLKDYTWNCYEAEFDNNIDMYIAGKSIA